MSKSRRRRRKGRLFVVQANGRERGESGMGGGSHHETSPMGHATATPTREGRRRKSDPWSRKAKHKGCRDDG